MRHSALAPFLGLVPILCLQAAACGVTIHNEVAYRASRILLSSSPANASMPLLREYAPMLEQKELLLAGSFFPDWGYDCIGKLWNEAAEEAHWPPFAQESIRYILETYPRPWNDHAKALITFLFGTVSHSLADMSWHALRGLDAGFIQALAQTSFEGDYSKGHTLADIGAEFVLSHMSTMDHLVTGWMVPVKDLVAIYARMGYFVPGPVLSHCMRNGFAGAQANARLGSQLFPVYASKSPFLVEQVEDYPMGGLHDMSAWTVDCWHGLAQYLDQDLPLPPPPPPETSAADPTVKESFRLCYALWEDRFNQSNQNRTADTSRERQVRHDHGHHHYRTGAKEGRRAMSRLLKAGLRVRTEEAKDDSGMVTFSILENTPKRSSTTADERKHVSQSKAADTCLSFQEDSTQTENLHSNNSPSKESSLARTLYLPLEYSAFGHAVVVGDFDGDGEADLAVSAPHMTEDPLVPSQGAVYIVPSRSLDQGPDPPHADVRLVASRILKGDPSQPQSRFGWSMAVVDLNQDGIDDLAIGAPGWGAKGLTYHGSVEVYFGHQGTGLSIEPDLVLYPGLSNETEPSNLMAGLGYVVRGMDLTGTGVLDLVLAMPMATVISSAGTPGQEDGTEVKKQAGKVCVFLAASAHAGHKTVADSDWSLEGEDSFGWFGSSLAVLSLSRPQEHQRLTMMRTVTNRVWQLMDTVFSLTRPQGTQAKLHPTADANSLRVLVVGSPVFGTGEQEAMRGKLQVFKILPLNSPGLIPERLLTIHGDAKFQQLGSRLASTRSNSQTLGDLLVVGSQSEDILKHLPKVGRNWQAGMVRILDLSKLVHGSSSSSSCSLAVQPDLAISDLDADSDTLRDSLQGSQSMAHLSAAMDVASDGQSLWLAEPYAKAEAGRILQWVPDIHRSSRASGVRSVSKNSIGVRGRKLVEMQNGERARDTVTDWTEQDGNNGDEDEGKIKQCFIGSDFRGRFGSQLLITDLNKDGVDDIVVTSSHASQYAMMAGTLTIKLRA